MDAVFEAIEEWLKEILIGIITNNLEGSFEFINMFIGDVAGMASADPATYNSSVFSIIESVHNSVIVPIAGCILTMVACFELIQMIIDKNSFRDMDIGMLFKWVFKTSFAVMIVSNAYTLIMGVFDVGIWVVTNSGSAIVNANAELDVSSLLANMQTELLTEPIDLLLALCVESFFLRFVACILGLAICMVMWGRMMEIYIMISLAAIPLATLNCRETSGIGQNYIKSIAALSFQGFLMLVCVAIYAGFMASLMPDVTSTFDFGLVFLKCIGCAGLLVFILFKTGGISKSIFNAR